MTTIVTNTAESRRAAIEMIGQPRAYVVTISEVSKYTENQRKALHLWCAMCAQYLNGLGTDFWRVSINPITGRELITQWTKDTFKEDVYKAILNAITGKYSTNSQTRTEPTDVVETIRDGFMEAKGVELPEWPTKFNYWIGLCVSSLNRGGAVINGSKFTKDAFKAEFCSQAVDELGSDCLDEKGFIDDKIVAEYIIDAFLEELDFKLPGWP